MKSSDTIPFCADSVLYYPHIEFFSTDWLKRALTIWDRVYRVVPVSYAPNDTDEVRQAVDAGAVVDLRLTTEDLAEISVDFIKFLGPVGGRPAGLWPEGGPTSTIHEEKVDARLRPLMRSLCAKVRADEWMELPSEIANGYMLFLAEVAARRRHIPRLTDNPDVFSVMQYYVCDGHISDYVYDREAAESTSALSMQLLVPAGVAQAPMERVLDFRGDFEEGRHLFRTLLAQMTTELSQIEDLSFARERARFFLEKLRKAPEVRARSLTQFGEHLTSVLFSVAVPTALSAFGVLAAGVPHDPFNGVNVGGSAFIGAIAALGQAGSDYRKGWNTSKASYLLGLESKFGSERSYDVPHFASRMEEFIND